MMPIKDADLTQAAQAYAVANTPLFLIRKLNEDASVNQMSSLPGNELFHALELAIGQRPESLIDYVRPYAYLVALSKQPQVSYLRDVTKISKINDWDWLSYIAEVLLQTYAPTTFIKTQPMVKPSLPANRSNAAVDRQKITLDNS